MTKIYAVPEDVLLRLISCVVQVPDCGGVSTPCSWAPGDGCDSCEQNKGWVDELICAECGCGSSLDPASHEGCPLQPLLKGLVEI